MKRIWHLRYDRIGVKALYTWTQPWITKLWNFNILKFLIKLFKKECRCVEKPIRSVTNVNIGL